MKYYEYAHWGDVLAIPGFIIVLLLLSYSKDKSQLFYVAMGFIAIACMCDIVFVYWWLNDI